jgi:hypothetical protein
LPATNVRGSCMRASASSHGRFRRKPWTQKVLNHVPRRYLTTVGAPCMHAAKRRLPELTYAPRQRRQDCIHACWKCDRMHWTSGYARRSAAWLTARAAAVDFIVIVSVSGITGPFNVQPPGTALQGTAGTPPPPTIYCWRYRIPTSAGQH